MLITDTLHSALTDFISTRLGLVITSKEIFEKGNEVGEPKMLDVIRTYAKKEGHGKYLIDENVLPNALLNTPVPKEAGAPKMVSLGRKAVAPLPTAPIASMAIVAEPTTEAVAAKVSDRIRSTDLKYDAITIPAKDPAFVGFGAFAVVKKLLASGVFAPMYIQGDSGYGKTILVEQACSALAKAMALVNVTNETSEDDLIGGLRIVGGDTVFEYGPVIRAYRDGAVLLLDELDQGTSQIMCLQTILQRKPYFIKKTGETIYPHPDFMVIATGNTKGLGDDIEGRFVGAQQLNEAFLERFSITMEHVAPAASIEKKILTNLGVDDNDAELLVKWANITRESAKAGVVNREIQTRRLVHIVANIAAFGDKKLAIELALNRFPEVVKEAMIRMYGAIDPELGLK